MLVVFKFGDRKYKGLSAKDGIQAHVIHSDKNNKAVLFTTKKFPRAQYLEDLTHIILTTANGKFAAIGEIVDAGRFANQEIFPVPSEYTVPSVYSAESEKMMVGWFAVKNLKEIIIERDMFTSLSGIDILDSLNSSANMIYANKNPKRE